MYYPCTHAPLLIQLIFLPAGGMEFDEKRRFNDGRRATAGHGPKEPYAD